MNHKIATQLLRLNLLGNTTEIVEWAYKINYKDFWIEVLNGDLITNHDELLGAGIAANSEIVWLTIVSKIDLIDIIEDINYYRDFFLRIAKVAKSVKVSVAILKKGIILDTATLIEIGKFHQTNRVYEVWKTIIDLKEYSFGEIVKIGREACVYNGSDHWRHIITLGYITNKYQLLTIGKLAKNTNVWIAIISKLDVISDEFAYKIGEVADCAFVWSAIIRAGFIKSEQTLLELGNKYSHYFLWSAIIDAGLITSAELINKIGTELDDSFVWATIVRNGVYIETDLKEYFLELGWKYKRSNLWNAIFDTDIFFNKNEILGHLFTIDSDRVWYHFLEKAK
jgi:hypothetical protein